MNIRMELFFVFHFSLDMTHDTKCGSHIVSYHNQWKLYIRRCGTGVRTHRTQPANGLSSVSLHGGEIVNYWEVNRFWANHVLWQIKQYGPKDENTARRSIYAKVYDCRSNFGLTKKSKKRKYFLLTCNCPFLWPRKRIECVLHQFGDNVILHHSHTLSIVEYLVLGVLYFLYYFGRLNTFSTNAPTEWIVHLWSHFLCFSCELQKRLSSSSTTE